MTVFALPCCKFRLPVAWSVTFQYSPTGRTRGSGFMGLEVGVLKVATWFAVSSYPCIRYTYVLYLCSCGTLGVPVAFWCAAGSMSSVSEGMMWSACWGDCLSASFGFDYMPPCGSTLGGDAGVDSGVFTLGGSVTCEGADLLNISENCLRSDLCLSPHAVIGIVGVGLSRAWLRSSASIVAASFDNIIGNVSVSR